jgi:hypothetical protein
MGNLSVMFNIQGIMKDKLVNLMDSGKLGTLIFILLMKICGQNGKRIIHIIG